MEIYHSNFNREAKAIRICSNKNQLNNYFAKMEDTCKNTGNTEFIKHTTPNMKFSAYHYHSNREPFYILFILKGDVIYIEMINNGTHRNKYTHEIVMLFEDMLKNENLKKYYDMSVMLVNDTNSVYYDWGGILTSSLIQTYDTESEDEEEAIPIRNWCISTERNWKNMRISKAYDYNCYYNINPFTFVYNVDTEKNIASFMNSINSFAKYHSVCRFIEAEITNNYKLRKEKEEGVEVPFVYCTDLEP